jgi:SAM-dependent MidA family methyltransferase
VVDCPGDLVERADPVLRSRRSRLMADAGPGHGLEAALAAHIAEVGPIGFDELVAHALYAPGRGFYTRGGGAGRRRDFLTSPEVGPLFGAVMARALDSWWDEMGRPDPFPVVEAGAGPGTLAATLLAAGPRCRDALRLTLVEVAEAQWPGHPPGTTSRATLPAPGELGPGPVVVLANELLDNLPFRLVERTADGWSEVRVAAEGPEGPLIEVLAPLDAVRAAWCDERAVVGSTGGRVERATGSGVGAAAGPAAGDEVDAPGEVAVGARMPVQADAASWLADALALAAGGRVVVLDYADTSASMARRPWRDWARTYARHGRGGHPQEAPGTQDITCEVAVDQLALIRPPDRHRSQAELLRAHGIDELVDEGRARWAAAGIAGGVAALAAQSRVGEAEALTDPTGLGAFVALEWIG